MSRRHADLDPNWLNEEMSLAIPRKKDTAEADPNAIVAVGDEAGSVEAAERRAAMRRIAANLNQAVRHLHGGGDADLRSIVLELRDVIAREVTK